MKNGGKRSIREIMKSKLKFKQKDVDIEAAVWYYSQASNVKIIKRR